jgi:hypothetical protein
VPEPALAVLVDFENVARPGAKSRNDFDIQLVLNRLAEKGRVLVKRAYADWSRYRDARHDLQNAGLELIELPSAREGAKNRADIKLAVDAMELAYSREHLDYFVIVSGDSDFTPLVGKMRELNKRVIGIAHKDSASDLLIANCDEFIFYESIAKAGGAGGRGGRGAGRELDAVDLVRETLEALQREGVEWPAASQVKDSMRRKVPSFDERDHGYSTFSKFLEAMRDHGTIRLETDARSGTYRVELTESRAPAPMVVAEERAAPVEKAEKAERDETGRRRRRRRRGSGDGPAGDADASTTADAEAALEDGMEVFEVTVTPTPDVDLGTLPSLDEPISYEDMLMLAPEVAAELPPVPEVAADEVAGPPPREARRRRRRGAREDEVALDKLEVAAGEEKDVEEEPAVAEPEPAPVTEGEAGAAEAPASTSRRRVPRRGVADVLGSPVEAETPAEEAKPKRRTRKKVAEEPQAAEVVAVEQAAPKRRVRKKAATDEAEVPEAAPAEVPAPKRRVRKKATAGDADVAEAAAAEEPAPKRRVRKKATAGDADVAEAPAAEEPAPRRRVRRGTVAAPAAEAPPGSEGIGPGKPPY